MPPLRLSHHQVVGPLIPAIRRRVKLDVLIETTESAELCGVRVEDDLIRSRLLNADAIVGEALLGVEVEEEEKTASLEHSNLVTVMLPTDVPLHTYYTMRAHRLNYEGRKGKKPVSPRHPEETRRNGFVCKNLEKIKHDNNIRNIGKKINQPVHIYIVVL